MDSSPPSSSHDNSWLAFSLSQQPHHSHLSLFEAFSSPNAAEAVDSTATTTTTTTSHHVPSAATDLAMFAGGPKLEDFLGGHLFSADHQTTSVSVSSDNNNNIITSTSPDQSVIYDSGLKTIAASFLRGYDSADQSSPTAAKKTLDTFGQRTSIYRGVTRHRWTGRYEAHLWDNSCRREGQSRKGRQVYLGGYDKEEKAARAYDLAALKYWGPTTTTNFPVSNYEKELEEMKNMTRQEFVASLRRKSSGFSRGASIYRGVTRHHQHGRWQARIGRVAGNKDLYLGTFSTQEEAAEAYDIAAIKFRGLNAVTNFDMNRYDVKSIANSNLPIGGISNPNNKPKHPSFLPDTKTTISTATPASSTSTLSFAMPIIKHDTNNSPDYWPANIFGFQNPNVISKNPSTVVPLVTTTGSTVSHDHHQRFSSDVNSNNIGGFFSYNNTNTVPFAMPINGGTTVNGNNNNNNSGSCDEISSPSGYNVNGFGWNNNNVGPSLQSLHHLHQTHAKPSALFQTPIFGME